MHILNYKHWSALYHLDTVLCKAALIWLLYELFVRILVAHDIYMSSKDMVAVNCGSGGRVGCPVIGGSLVRFPPAAMSRYP